MKTELTKRIEQCALKEFSATGNFICPEVGINIYRYGFPKLFYKYTKLTEQQMLDKGFKKQWYTDTEIVDILLWQNNKNIWKCFEIKISYSDFKSSASKTFVGNYNYYIVPDTLYNKIKDEVPNNIGIYVYNTVESTYRYYKYLKCVKRSKKQDLQCTQDEMYYAMIKSLYREVSKNKPKY